MVPLFEDRRPVQIVAVLDLFIDLSPRCGELLVASYTPQAARKEAAMMSGEANAVPLVQRDWRLGVSAVFGKDFHGKVLVKTVLQSYHVTMSYLCIMEKSPRKGSVSEPAERHSRSQTMCCLFTTDVPPRSLFGA